MTKEKFLNLNKKVINRFIRGKLAKDKVGIVHGARAQNAQLPTILQRKATLDWDIFVKKPKQRARQFEKFLDRKFRGDFFDVKKGKTVKLKVNKVISNITGESFIDFSIADRTIPTVAKRGVKLATLADQKQRALQTITDPTKLFRREKDLDLLRRIKQFEKIRGRKI